MAKTPHEPDPTCDQDSASNRLLLKNVTAVHSTGLGLLQRKLFNALLLTAYDDLMTKEEHEIDVNVLKALIEYDSNDLGRLRDALREIRGKPVEFNLLDRKDKGTWTITGLLSEATLTGGRCIFSFGKRMAEMLHRPEMYVLLNLRIQNRLQSAWSLNLYENIARFREVKSTGFYEVATWRKVLGATAAGFDEYKRFRSRVLRPAIKEINEQSDLWIELEEKRGRGRGTPVIELKFLITPNPQSTLTPFVVDPNEEIRGTDIYKQLRELKVPDRLALQAVSDDPKKAQQLAAAVRIGVKKGRIKNPGAYTSKLIVDGASLSPRQLEDAGVKATKAEAPPPELPAQPNNQETYDEIRTQLVRAYEQHRKQRCMDALDTDRKHALMDKWLIAVREDGQQFLLKGSRVDRRELSPMAQGAFERYVVRKLLGETKQEDVDRWLLTKTQDA